jgi:N-acyl-D-aspartate/D-glutamate deacylase
MRVRFGQQAGSGPESIQFREMEAHPELQGRTLADYLADRGRVTTVPEAVEALIELQLEGGFIGIFHGMEDGDVERIMRHPTAMFETDGDLVEPGAGFPHPRSYGSFPRVLARYVRERGVLTLEQAVHKMTGLTAAWHHQSERGLLRPGQFADIVVFDPERIADRSEYTDPHHYSEGVVWLLVNGETAIAEGEITGALPGRFLERPLAE